MAIKHRLLDVLPEGQENALTAKELATMLGTSSRMVTSAIQQLRREKLAICATCATDAQQGYFLPGNERELSSYKQALAKRIGVISKTLTSIIDVSFSDVTKIKEEMLLTKDKLVRSEGSKTDVKRG